MVSIGTSTSFNDMNGSTNFSGSNPPVLDNGDNYEDWKTAVKRWSTFTKFHKNQLASVVSVLAFKGEGKSLALSISDDLLNQDNGLEHLFEELDKLYLRDRDSIGFECYKKLVSFKRDGKKVFWNFVPSISDYEEKQRNIKWKSPILHLHI